MSDEEKKESVETGSSEDLIQADPFSPNLESEGESLEEESKKKDINLDDYVKKTQLEEAESKIGEQGKELGEYRGFYKEISPLLDKLKAEPEVVEAIMQGKIDGKLAQSVLEGKVSASDANEVTMAHEKIKKELGSKEYRKTSAEDIEKMISEKVNLKVAEETKNLKGVIKESDDRREFEDKVNSFVKNTPDFEKYAEEINAWLDEHPNQYDISIAYEAVKGREIINEAAKKESEKAVEAAKDLAGNAAGGLSQGGKIAEGKNLADELVSDISDPNVF